MSKPRKGKRFRYQLETLLKVRDIWETQQKEVFQAAEKKVVEEQEKEEEIKVEETQQYNTLVSEMKGEAGEPADVQKIMMRKAHLETLAKQLTEQQQVVKDAEEDREKEKKELVKKMLDKKIMEIDKDKTRDAWKKLMDKEAGKFLDDISAVGFEKKRRLAAEEEGLAP